MVATVLVFFLLTINTLDFLPRNSYWVWIVIIVNILIIKINTSQKTWLFAQVLYLAWTPCIAEITDIVLQDSVIEW